MHHARGGPCLTAATGSCFACILVRRPHIHALLDINLDPTAAVSCTASHRRSLIGIYPTQSCA